MKSYKLLNSNNVAYITSCVYCEFYLYVMITNICYMNYFRAFCGVIIFDNPFDSR